MGTTFDIRYALRLLTRTPAFTVPAIASLAVGIAVTTTMFSVVNAVLLRPLGMPESGDLVRIGRSARGQQSFRSPEQLLCCSRPADCMRSFVTHSNSG